MINEQDKINIIKLLLIITLFFLMFIAVGISDVNAQSVSRIYLELKSNSKNITCNNTDECEYTTITKNSPFDILAIRQTGLTISANSEHYYEINFNVNSFIPLGSEEWYFNEPIFRVINSSGTKYDVTCKSKTWSLVQDFTQLGDRVYRSYRYACNWDTAGEYVAVELVMDTQAYDGFNTTFTGVKVNSWNYSDSIGAGAIIENQNQNTDLIINNQNQNQEQTNDRLDNINDSLTSTDNPDNLNQLTDIAGYFPAGPLDSLINLPLSLLNSLNTALGSTCNPVIINLPFVNKPITLPCISTIYGQIDGLNLFFNSVGLIAGTFLLYNYFLYLRDWLESIYTLDFINGNGSFIFGMLGATRRSEF